MKTVITTSALLFVSNVALAESWEDALQNPDLNTGVYDKPVTLVEPRASMGAFSISLDEFGRGNPDHSAHDQVIEGSPIRSREGFATSLDQALQGNPDHV